MRQFFLQLLVNGLGAADEAHAGEAISPFLERLPSRLDDLGMIGESEIVVGAEIQRRVFTANPNSSGLRRLNDAFRLVEAGIANLFQFGAKLFFEFVGVHGYHSRSTLPDWPELAVAKASSKSVKGKRWVMTGATSSPLCSMTVILYQVSYISRP